MSNLGTAFLVLAILSLASVFFVRHIPIGDGLAKAMFGVFMIGYFIIRFFGEKEPHS